MASLGWCHPGRLRTVSPFFSEKMTTFLVIALCKVMTFLADVSSQLPPSDVVLSSVLSKFSHNFFFIRVSPLDGVIRGCLPLVTPLQTSVTNRKTNRWTDRHSRGKMPRLTILMRNNNKIVYLSVPLSKWYWFLVGILRNQPHGSVTVASGSNQ